jgi:hypothetical protein
MIDVSLGPSLARMRTYGVKSDSVKQNGAHAERSPEEERNPGKYPEFQCKEREQADLAEAT